MKKHNSNHVIALFLFISLALILTACYSNSQAAADKPEKQREAAYAQGGQFSGDDLYDPASNIIALLIHKGAGSSYSGDDVYDPAANFPMIPIYRDEGMSYSGDDPYDPAAGGLTR